VQITRYARQDHTTLMRFLGHQERVHYHLDWQPLNQWLRDSENWVGLAWDGSKLVGAMAFSPAHRDTAWLRLLTVAKEDAHEIFQVTSRVVAAMAPHPWISGYLMQHGFDQTETVINLSRAAQPLTSINKAVVKVRGLHWGEATEVLTVDHMAFEALWQMRPIDLREAGRRSSHYTVACHNKKVIGYQLSMRYGQTMHLARLATLPEYQNRGVASALLYDLISHAEQQKIEWVTVNTQESNTSSRHLYERFGFQRDFHDMPIYSFKV
jgi:ribosomal protein S18 acetylase RimI-like enzyme